MLKQQTTKWLQYLARGSSGASSANLGASGRLHLAWKDGHRSAFPVTWLRDHSPESYHPSTQQRQIDTYSIPRSSNLVKSATLTDSHLKVQWHSKATSAAAEPSVFPLTWLREHCTSDLARALRTEHAAGGSSLLRTLWGSDLFSASSSSNGTPPTLHYDEVLGSQQGLTALMQLLHVYGIALVTGCPTTMEGTEALAKSIGVVRHTLYGGMWATSAEGGEQAHNDTAYTNHALGSHTDCTYMIDPPGLQVSLQQICMYMC
jgi:trimethyllysine dioxygenase